MLNKVFTIYDSKTDAHHAPFTLATIGQATREFTDLANNPQSNIHKHPEDYTLIEIGQFDDTKGILIPHDKVHLIGTALSFVTQNENADQIKLTGL